MALVVARPLCAQTPSSPPPRVEQQVIVSATLAPTPLDAVGRSVFVLTREDLDRLGISSIVDALRFVPGVDPRARGPHDIQTDFSIRGATFGQSLVLVDGIRLNDAQSGHHNGDIPAAVASIDRIEVVEGPGSAVHGADALGGTINVVSRRGTFADLTGSAGEHGLVSGQGSFSGHGLPAHTMAAIWGSRSNGFTADREFASGGGQFRADLTPAISLDVRHLRKAFGANGFYGPSPSKEWTDQTLAALTYQTTSGGWITSARGYLRDHGDHFRWDINRPGFAENTHRSNGTEFLVTLRHLVGSAGQLTVGASGGADWIHSSNLGDHTYARSAGFAELQWPLAERATLQSGVRVDSFSTFGSSVSPSMSVSVRVTPDIRLRGSAGRAFRVPTFTELYYTDPSNLGSSELHAEHGWSADGGVDWVRQGWTVSFTPFHRHDSNVIDWVRATPAERWRSTNVRGVATSGFETSVTRRWRDALVRFYYAGLDVDAPALTTLSKYVLEYARHQSGGSIALQLPAALHLAANFDHRHRLDGQSYDLVALRIGHALPRVRGEVFLDATNLLNESYHEVAGVSMPGRWLAVGVKIAR